MPFKFFDNGQAMCVSRIDWSGLDLRMKGTPHKIMAAVNQAPLAMKPEELKSLEKADDGEEPGPFYTLGCPFEGEMVSKPSNHRRMMKENGDISAGCVPSDKAGESCHACHGFTNNGMDSRVCQLKGNDKRPYANFPNCFKIMDNSWRNAPILKTQIFDKAGIKDPKTKGELGKMEYKEVTLVDPMDENIPPSKLKEMLQDGQEAGKESKLPKKIRILMNYKWPLIDPNASADGIDFPSERNWTKNVWLEQYKKFNGRLEKRMTEMVGYINNLDKAAGGDGVGNYGTTVEGEGGGENGVPPAAAGGEEGEGGLMGDRNPPLAGPEATAAKDKLCTAETWPSIVRLLESVNLKLKYCIRAQQDYMHMVPWGAGEKSKLSGEDVPKCAGLTEERLMEVYGRVAKLCGKVDKEEVARL